MKKLWNRNLQQKVSFFIFNFAYLSQRSQFLWFSTSDLMHYLNYKNLINLPLCRFCAFVVHSIKMHFKKIKHDTTELYLFSYWKISLETFLSFCLVKIFKLEINYFFPLNGHFLVSFLINEEFRTRNKIDQIRNLHETEKKEAFIFRK